MRGHTKIELTDVNTGEVTVHEEENMLTSMYPRLWQPFGDGWSAGSYYAKNKAEFWDKAVGGVLLFDRNIDEDPTITMAPGSAVPIACAGAVVNTGTTAMLGSYNETESEHTQKRVKKVWDFATHQANGPIGCICLTSTVGGRVGYGHMENDVDLAASYREQSSPYGFGVDITNPQATLAYCEDNIAYFIDYNNIVYSADYADVYVRNTKKLRFKKVYVPIDAYSVSVKLTNEVMEEIELDIPDTLANTLKTGTSAMYGAMSYDKGNIYVFLTDSAVAAGATFYVIKIAVTESGLATPELITLTNTTGVQFTSLAFNYYTGGYQYIDNTHFYIYNTNRNIYRISLSNPTDVQQIVDPEGNPAVAPVYTGISYTFVRYFTNASADYVYLQEAIFSTNTGSGYYYNRYTPCMINKKTGVMWETMISLDGLIPQPVANSTRPKLYPYIGDESVRLYVTTNGVFPFIAPNYLFTINNVSPTITKTAAQTMKITYTLTEE